MSKVFRTAAALLLAAAMAAPALAQTLTGSITGTIKDEQGAVLPGVTVTLTGKQGTQNQVTDANGVYRFPALEVGTYAISAELSGFAKASRSDLVISPNRELTIDLAMKIGALAENITVTGESPVVDVKSSATETTISQSLLFSAPITRTAINVINYAPGVNSSSAYGGGAGSGIDRDGRRARELQHTLPARDRDLPAVELLQQVLLIGGDDVDDFLLLRFRRRQARRFGDRLFAPFGIAAAQLREAADVSGRVLHRLALVRIRRRRLLVVRLGRRGGGREADRHRRCRAEVRAGRHCGDMARIQDERAGARRARTRRRDVRNDRHRRRENVLHDSAHRRVESAWRIERQHDELRVVLCGAGKPALQVFAGSGADDAGDVQRDDRCGRGGKRRRERADQCQCRQESEDAHCRRIARNAERNGIGIAREAVIIHSSRCAAAMRCDEAPGARRTPAWMALRFPQARARSQARSRAAGRVRAIASCGALSTSMSGSVP